MRLKEFFRLTKWKVILFIFLIILSSFPHYPSMEKGDISGGECIIFGYPMTFYDSYMGIECFAQPDYNYLGLISNLIFWYLVSCLVIFSYSKIKKIKK